MLRGLQDGQLPVRWSANLGYGYGMPLFQFYAPLPFVVGAVFLWLRLDVVLVLKLLYLISNVGTLLGAYLLGKRLFGKTGGWVSATAYTLAPYRAVNLYVRGALSEAWAMMALPWVLLGIVMVIRKERAGLWIFLGGLLTLFLSHNLTTLMFVPISGVFAVYYWLSQNHPAQKQQLQTRLSELLKLLAGYLLAIGLSAFYIFPALLENQFTKIYTIFSGYFSYQNHFLYIRQFFNPKWGYGGSAWGPNDDMSYFLGYGQLVALGLFVLSWLLTLFRKKRLTAQLSLSVLLVILMAASAYMTLLRSQFIWDAVPLLQTIQFPWRWLSVVSLMVALLAGSGVALLPRKLLRLGLGSILIIIMALTSWNYFRPEKYLDTPDSIYYTDPDRIRAEMSQVLPDYIPRTMSDQLEVRKELFLVPAGTEKQVEVVIDRSSEKLFKTTFLSDVALNVLIADYPGWTVQIDGQPAQHTAKGQFGTILIDVPGGEHLVGVYLGSTPVRMISDSISLLSLLILFGVATYASLAGHRARRSTRD